MRPPLRTTHTFVKLEVSAAAFDEIQQKIVDADYMHCFIDDAIEMSGIGLVRGPEPIAPSAPDLVVFGPNNTRRETASGPTAENGGIGEAGGLLNTDELPPVAAALESQRDRPTGADRRDHV